MPPSFFTRIGSLSPQYVDEKPLPGKGSTGNVKRFTEVYASPNQAQTASLRHLLASSEKQNMHKKVLINLSSEKSRKHGTVILNVAFC